MELAPCLTEFYIPALKAPRLTTVLRSVAGRHRAIIPLPALDKSAVQLYV